MGLLGVKERGVTGAQWYHNAKPGKREVDSWTILQEIRGSYEGRHSTVREIIICVGLEEHIHATCIRSIEVRCGETIHIAWWYSEDFGIH